MGRNKVRTRRIEPETFRYYDHLANNLIKGLILPSVQNDPKMKAEYHDAIHKYQCKAHEERLKELRKLANHFKECEEV